MLNVTAGAEGLNASGTVWISDPQVSPALTPARARQELNSAGLSESDCLLTITDLLAVRHTVPVTPNNLRTLINLMGCAY